MEAQEIVKQEFGENKIPVIYSKHLDEKVIGEMEKVRKHSGNYITLFVRNQGAAYEAYFGSCQTDNQLRLAIATGESLDVKTDSQGYPALNGYAGTVTLSKEGKVSGIFLLSRGMELTSEGSDVKLAIKAVAGKIDKKLFTGSSVKAVVDLQGEYMVDPENLNVFKNITSR